MKISSSAYALQLPPGKTEKFLVAGKSNSLEYSDSELPAPKKTENME